MYLDHWQLGARPFASDFDARTFCPISLHQSALLELRYALETHAPAAMLVGPPGSGKSLLVHLLRGQAAAQHTPWCTVVFPQVDPRELLARITRDLMPARSDETSAAHTATPGETIERSLLHHANEGRHPIVVIDDAHQLAAPEAFVALRSLLNVTIDGRPPLTLLLVGQPPLLATLVKLPWFEEHLQVQSLLRALTPDETAEYVRHRLNAVGAQNEIFDPAAIGRLHELAAGNPRRVNRLADLALLVGYAEERGTIDASLVERVAQGLLLQRAA